MEKHHAYRSTVAVKVAGPRVPPAQECYFDTSLILCESTACRGHMIVHNDVGDDDDADAVAPSLSINPALVLISWSDESIENATGPTGHSYRAPILSSVPIMMLPSWSTLR